jgi:hypothetical protein
MVSIFRCMIQALMLTFTVSTVAFCLQERMVYVNAIKECDVAKVQELFDAKRPLFSDVLLLAEEKLKENVKQWLLFAALEKENLNLVWNDWLLPTFLIPKQLYYSAPSEPRKECPSVKEFVWWYLKNKPNDLAYFLLLEGARGHAFTKVAQIFLNDDEMLTYIIKNYFWNVRFLLGAVSTAYKHKKAAQILGGDYAEHESSEENSESDELATSSE